VLSLRNISRLTFHVSRTAVENSLRVLLVPGYSQVCFVKTDRGIIGATSALRPSSAILSSYVFGMCERGI